jgi:methylmalonyl-CoA carboxyltransferase small subunit
LKLQIKIDGKTYAAEVEVIDEEQSEQLPGYTPPAVAPVPGAYVPSQPHSISAANEKEYRSPLAALVVKVHVREGQEVEANDLLMVLEAMKMETNVTAHHAGKVKTISVVEGAPVKPHQILIEME